jgi:hypothetical protein
MLRVVTLLSGEADKTGALQSELLEIASRLAAIQLSREVRAAMNRAGAAVMFDKPWGAVSATAAKTAEASDYFVEGDEPKTDRARRAALTAGLNVLAARGAMTRWMTDYVADVFALLGRGVAEGFARPAPVKKKGRGSVARDRIAAAVAEETHFTIGAIDLSREAALSKVTGVQRSGAQAEPPRAPVIPLRQSSPTPKDADGGGDHGPFSHARRLLERGEELIGPLGRAYARAQGEFFRRGEPADPDYMRDRKRRLKLFADSAARRWLFEKARDRHSAP